MTHLRFIQILFQLFKVDLSLQWPKCGDWIVIISRFHDSCQIECCFFQLKANVIWL